MASDSATHAATQQSIKAYVDSGTVTMTNKTLTSPTLNTGVSGTAVKDEDDMTSDSATHLATQQSIKAYVDAAPAAQMTPSTYAGEESVTLPNGLIMKMGYKTSTTVTFGAAFPTGVISVNVTGAVANGTGKPDDLSISGVSTTGFTIYKNGTYDGYYWMALGY